MTRAPIVYLLVSTRRGTLYVGVTSNLALRVWQHRQGLVAGFTRRYEVKALVWYERHPTMASAIGKEKLIKRWRREWKLELVEESNVEWRDLWPDIVGSEPMPVTLDKTAVD